MSRPVFLFALPLLAACAATPPQPDARRQCDLAAASNLDTTRPADIEGILPGKVDPNLALAPCEAALATDPDNPRLMFQLGRAAYEAKDYERSLRLYVTAAGRGHIIAANNAGVQFEKGQGTARDQARAEHYYTVAAEAGLAIAMRNLGEQLTKHESPTAEAEAVFWFRRAAEAGHSGGMVWYGYMLENGWGTRMDQKQAAAWYRRAAEADNTDGMTAYAVMLLEGRGVPRNRAEALILLGRAAEMGHPDAKKRLAALTPRASR